MHTLNLSFTTLDGRHRTVTIPAEAAKNPNNDVVASLSFIIIALHDRLTIAEEHIANLLNSQEYMPLPPGWVPDAPPPDHPYASESDHRMMGSEVDHNDRLQALMNAAPTAEPMPPVALNLRGPDDPVPEPPTALWGTEGLFADPAPEPEPVTSRITRRAAELAEHKSIADRMRESNVMGSALSGAAAAEDDDLPVNGSPV